MVDILDILSKNIAITGQSAADKKRRLTDAERKQRKRESDRKYRMAKKGLTPDSIHDESNRLINAAIADGRISFVSVAEETKEIPTEQMLKEIGVKPTKKVGKCTHAHNLHDQGLSREAFRLAFQAVFPDVPDANCDWYRNWAARQARG